MAGVNNILESVREDDFVEYYLFPVINSEDIKEQETILSCVLSKANKIIDNYSKNYLWHKDEFKLVPRTSISNLLTHIDGKNEKLPPHLYGVSHFGDNIEDEWFMVFILQQLTKEINGLAVKVYDSDGEFILIEAADFLPDWADPETCENRVYLYESNVHIIPMDSEEEKELTVSSALSKLFKNPTETKASQDIQNTFNNKLKGYPEKTKDNIHRSTIYVPIGVAAILKLKPTLIAPAIQAFCNRDSVDLRACRAMKYFPPENRVNTSVNFTKCMYAMLTHSKFVPDRRTGWNLPHSSSPQFKAHNLGLRVASGFEILISQAKPSAEIESDKGWANYLQSLKNKGYFQDLMENSRDYNNLLNKAKEYYINHRDSMQYMPAVGQQILELTKTLDYNADELKKAESDLPKDDDDSWLDISPEELDQMLQEKYGQKKFINVNNNTDPGMFTDKVKNFINHVSEVEGAEFPNHSPQRPPRGVKSKNKVSFSKDTKADENKSNNKVNFDPNSFSCAVQNILNFVIPEDDSWDQSGSDMSEYEDDIEVNNGESYAEVNAKMKKYMDEMDRELAKTTIGESFEKKTNGDGFDDIENFRPVDIDVNALKNILESYKSQLGEAGPSSNMLGPMGVHLDTNENAKVE
ncbi:unnamed protein product [Brassicogethes aeneus]|uniref:Uncharacterized protein n=1 Tax=Brassicogethes aeneus TaxID=1431903 RepID=A0A9P0AT56_BRAAE|nr:unnamed protein product [Brassicogethes aeneus]